MANDSSPDPYITMLYEATKGGYKAFKKDIMLAHHAGYKFHSTTNIGEKSFFAVFALDGSREQHEYTDFAGLDDFGRETF